MPQGRNSVNNANTRKNNSMLKSKRCMNHEVDYAASAGIFFNALGSRFSKSSTVSACGSAVNT